MRLPWRAPLTRAISLLCCLALAGAPLGCSGENPSARVPVASAPTSGLDQSALSRLRERARATNSDVLIVAQNGQIVVDDSVPDLPPLALMSITKSIAALAIGALIQDGSLSSVDLPAHTYIPRWQIGPRAAITLRHLLEHTSGLEAAVDSTDVYASPDHIEHAALATLKSPPGTRFFYNNRAVAVLAQVVAMASGLPLDQYIYTRLYAPLGIATRSWGHDSRNNAMVMAGARLTGRELLAIGQLVLDGGKVGDRQLVDPAWLLAATGSGSTANPLHGQLWWLVPAWSRHRIDAETLAAWRSNGVDADLLTRLAPLVDQEHDPAAFRKAVAAALGNDAPTIARWTEQLARRGLPTHATRSGPILGCRANGYLGQHLVVLRDRGIVAVRLIRPERHTDPEHSFSEFVEMVREL